MKIVKREIKVIVYLQKNNSQNQPNKQKRIPKYIFECYYFDLFSENQTNQVTSRREHVLVFLGGHQCQEFSRIMEYQVPKGNRWRGPLTIKGSHRHLSLQLVSSVTPVVVGARYALNTGKNVYLFCCWR